MSASLNLMMPFSVVAGAIKIENNTFMNVNYNAGNANTNNSGLMGLVTYCTGIVVVCIIAAMIALNFDITTSFAMCFGQTRLVFQDILDQILPKFLPLAFTMGFYFALRKNVKANTLMLWAVVIGFVLGACGLI